ncbi:hypothetical protein QJS10_CPA03g00640 [Acorus calamus]|uniref:Uncharacterized protein n=1 Tax=Acorus calamus TaxID=4465 RepID=A0AAV9F8P7_ACOCL|nr:hypothetical protein QJS10_CPA03g00640 [Acorus calamus]
MYTERSQMNQRATETIAATTAAGVPRVTPAFCIAGDGAISFMSSTMNAPMPPKTAIA